MSTLTLVDLAGSERIAKTGAEGQRAKEVSGGGREAWATYRRGWTGPCAADQQALQLSWAGVRRRRPLARLTCVYIAPHAPQWFQGAAINKSLLTLGTVINKLSEGVAAQGETASWGDAFRGCALS